jgi:hypothetical protein
MVKRMYKLSGVENGELHMMPKRNAALSRFGSWAMMFSSSHGRSCAGKPNLTITCGTHATESPFLSQRLRSGPKVRESIIGDMAGASSGCVGSFT